MLVAFYVIIPKHHINDGPFLACFNKTCKCYRFLSACLSVGYRTVRNSIGMGLEWNGFGCSRVRVRMERNRFLQICFRPLIISAFLMAVINENLLESCHFHYTPSV